MKINEILAEINEFQNVGLGAEDQVITAVEKYCQNYLNKIGGVENALFLYPLWRGMKKFKFPENQQIMKIRVNQARLPLDTTKSLHKAADNWFRLATGIPFRSTSFFASGRYDVARGYDYLGETVITLPVENFNYCWSPEYRDMTYDFESFVVDHSDNYTNGRPVSINDSPEIITMLEDFLEAGNYQFNIGLIEVIESGNEIMFSCKESLIINKSWKIRPRYDYEDM